MQGYYVALLIIDFILLTSLVLMTANNSIMKKGQRRGFLIDAALVASVIILEYVTNYYNGKPFFSSIFFYALNYLYFAIPLFVSLVVLYSLPSYKKLLRIFMIIEGGFSALILVLTITGQFFYFDENNVYHRGPLYFFYIIAYAVAIFYLLFEIIRMLVIFQNKNRAVLVLIIMMLIFACVVQLFFPTLYIAWSIIAILLFVFYAYCNELWQQLDSLTNLLNSTSFNYDIQHMKNNAILIIFDLDDFQEINKNYGRAMGDKCLIEAARAILTFYSKKGRCYRTGVDKFSVIFRGNEEEVQELDDRICKLLDKKREQFSQLPYISSGYAKYKFGSDVSKTVSKADASMYLHKRIQKNERKGIIEEEVDEFRKYIGGQALEDIIDETMERNEFKVFYQPKYDARTLKLSGAEALVRWQIGDGKFVQPGSFVSSLEREGLIHIVDEYVFREVCHKMKEWKDNGINVVPISVNLSRMSLCQPDAIKLYQDIINENQTEQELVPIEVTESAAVSSTIVKEMTDRLHDAGFLLHLDDFGTGYSSLGSLNSIQFDVVKLDKTIVDSIGNPGTDSLIRHIIAFCHEGGMKIVAEGVENESQIDFLQKAECDTFQGFYFSKPIPEEEFEKLLQ